VDLRLADAKALRVRAKARERRRVVGIDQHGLRMDQFGDRQVATLREMGYMRAVALEGRCRCLEGARVPRAVKVAQLLRPIVTTLAVELTGAPWNTKATASATQSSPPAACQAAQPPSRMSTAV